MAFTGKAVYGDQVFSGIAEDVSPIISLISPFETPLLDALGDALYPAKSVLHEWLEDSLQPDTVVSSVDIGSTGAATAIGIAGGLAAFLRVGTVLQVGVNYNSEVIQISAISGNTITVTRALGGTSATSYGAGQSLTVLSDNALEGDDVDADTSRPRLRKTNYVEIFKADVIVSGTMLAVAQLGGIVNEFDYQQQKRMREMLKSLERKVIRGYSFGNTLGSASAYRTMSGIIPTISTNIHSIGTLSDDYLATVIRSAWQNGGVDVDLMCADGLWKRSIDGLASSRISQLPQEETLRTLVTMYESSYGVQKVTLSRWMPQYTLLSLATARAKPTPLQGRTFQFTPVAKSGDSEKGMVVGEYTIEFRNEEGHAFAHR